MMSQKILVTGGAGYIGSHVVKQLGKAGYKIIVLDNLSTGNENAVTYGELVKGDLSDKDLLDFLFKHHQFDAVMHFAGSIIVPESVEKPDLYYQNNTINSFHLMQACLKYKVKNFIFSSTAATYGILPQGYAAEDLPTHPINPYGESKLMTESMLKDLSLAYEDFNYVALRYFNVSGADPEGEIGQAFPGATHLIKVNCEAASGKRDKTFIFGTDFETPDGTGVRDYIHVVDLANAHLKALDYLQAGGKSDVFNCGYGKGFSVREVIKAVKEVTKVDYPVVEAPRRLGDPAILVSKVDKIRSHLNWSPEYDDLNFIIKTAYEWEKSEVFARWGNSK
jgi:UDP-glucose 4-epimerase